MTVHEQLKQITSALSEVSSEARCEAELILAHAYGICKSALVMRFFDEAEHAEKISGWVRQRLRGRPLAYVLGEQNFYGRDFYVDERVLIPRFDSESVAQEAIIRIRQRGYRNIADICCGSGCLGITILLETDVDSMLFGDISKDALQVSRRNFEALAPRAKAHFCQGDLLDVLEEPVDLIVSNPPYIPVEEFPVLESQVRDYEPRLALLGGTDGLDFYRRLAQESGDKLCPGGTIVCEIGDGQARACVSLFAQAGFEDIDIGKDVAGALRWLAACRK